MIKPERRTNPMPERRIAERVALLEIRADNHADALDKNQELLMKFFEKLDEHITEETVTIFKIETGMNNISNVVSNLTEEIKHTNGHLTKFSEKIESTSDKVNKWDTIAATLIKITSILAIAISATWTVYTFVVDHSDQVITRVK